MLVVLLLLLFASVVVFEATTSVAVGAAASAAAVVQSTFVFKGFDEVRRLGLRQETEAVVRLAKARSHGAPGMALRLLLLLLQCS
jgi:hypothetical protein